MLKKNALSALVVMVGALALSLSAAPTAVAQETQESKALDKNLYYFDLNFPGGTLQQYADAIRKAHGSANVMISEEAKKARIPSVTLNGVTFEAAIRLLEGQSLVRDEKSTGIRTESVGLVQRNETAYRVSLYPWESRAERLKKQASKNTDQPTAERRSNVWSLRDLVDAGMKMDDVLGTVKMALKTIDKPSEIRLHEPTSLLIVRGTEEQLDLVDQTVSAMIVDVQNRAGEAEYTAGQIDNLQGELVKAEAARRVAEKKLEIESERAKRNQQDFEKRRPGLTDEQSATSMEIIREYELEMIQAQGELQIAQDKVDRLTKHIKRLQGVGSKPAKPE